MRKSVEPVKPPALPNENEPLLDAAGQIATDPAGCPLAIRLLGPWDVRLHGDPLSIHRSRRGQWLLALLVLQRGRPVKRDWLAGVLWPDSRESNALYNLRANVWDLRRALGPEAGRLRTPTPRTLAFDLAFAFADVVEFDEAIARGDTRSLEAAVELYRGPLLAGCSEEWVLGERAAREQAYLTALETLAGHAMARGEPVAAARYARQAIATDPFRESAQRALMQALAAGGDYASATLAYRDFRLLLQQELLAQPSPETQALYQQLRSEARRGAVPARSRLKVPASRLPEPTFNLQPSNLEPPRSAPRRLPSPWSSFIGRESEIAEVAAALADARLVTLTGTGGVGKTRLAIRVAEETGDDYAGGAWFVDLAGLSDPTLVPQTVAAALEVPELPNRSLVAAVQEFLHPKELLLVVDNCEHLVEACARLAEALLSGAPHLRILATSRQSLGLLGEVVWRVPSLSLPAAEEGSRVKGQGSRVESRESKGLPWTLDPRPLTLLQSDAVRLFVERARQADPTFDVTPDNIRMVAALCQRLDGIPLALELAAARLKAMSLSQATSRLQDGFGYLTGESRQALTRQQTLRATMDWSYALLSAPEQALLRRLSVFAGGFTLEAAEGVCGGGMTNDQRRMSNVQCPMSNEPASPIGHLSLDIGHSPVVGHWSLPEGEVLDLLSALVDKSLVRYEEREDEGRYRLLETVRQYAHDRLWEAREAPAVRGRHLSFFLRLVQEASLKLLGGEQGVWLDRLERDHDNLNAAIDWSLATEEGWKEGLPLIVDLFPYWDLRNRCGEALEYLKRFAERSADWPIDARVQVLHLAGFVAMKQADYPAARKYFEESRTLRRQQGALQEDPGHLHRLGALALHEGDYAQAAALLHESLRIYREYEEAGRDFAHGTMAWTVDILGLVAYDEGDFHSARAYYEQSLTLFRGMDGKTGIASALHGLGRVAMRQCEYSLARALLDESLSLFRDVKAKHSAVGVLNSLAWIGWHEGEYATARAHVVEALVLCRETGRYWQIIDTLVSAGHLSQRQDEPARAARLFGAAEGLRAGIGEAMPPVERAEYASSMTAARAALGEEAFAAAWTEGRAMTREQAVAYALIGGEP